MTEPHKPNCAYTLTGREENNRLAHTLIIRQPQYAMHHQEGKKMSHFPGSLPILATNWPFPEALPSIRPDPLGLPTPARPSGKPPATAAAAAHRARRPAFGRHAARSPGAPAGSQAQREAPQQQQRRLRIAPAALLSAATRPDPRGVPAGSQAQREAPNESVSGGRAHRPPAPTANNWPPRGPNPGAPSAL